MLDHGFLVLGLERNPRLSRNCEVGEYLDRISKSV
jgi:hypothetical protein